MSVAGAFAGGIMNFFSIWIFCMMQIIPFLSALIVGAALTADGNGRMDYLKAGAVYSVICLAGYVAAFTVMGSPQIELSKMAFRYFNILNQTGGAIALITGCYFAGILTLNSANPRLVRGIHAAGALLFGLAVGVAYKPCVTPALTMIYNIAKSPGMAGDGIMLLVSYSSGASLTILAFGSALAWITTAENAARHRQLIRRACGGLIIIFALLVLTNNMTNYKSFLVGRFVPDEGHVHDGAHQEPHL